MDLSELIGYIILIRILGRIQQASAGGGTCRIDVSGCNVIEYPDHVVIESGEARAVVASNYGAVNGVVGEWSIEGVAYNNLYKPVSGGFNVELGGVVEVEQSGG